MVPTATPPQIPAILSADYMPSSTQLADFNNPHVSDVIKTFLLRQFTKKEIRENERLNILTDVTIVDLQSNQTIIGHNESTPHFAASINKLPVTMLLLEELRAGHTTLDTVVTWQESDRRAGNGIYDQPGVYQATVRDVLHDMLNRSGNTAVRIFVNKVLGGNAAVNARLALVPQIPHTRLIPVDADRFFLGDTTSKEALFVLRNVLSNQDQYGQYVKQLLSTNIFVNDGVRSQLAGNDYIVLANKTGLLFDPDGNNNHDVGIVYNTRTHKSYGYSYLTTAPSASDEATVRGADSVKIMGKYTLRFSGDKPVQNQQPHTLLQQNLVPESKVLY